MHTRGPATRRCSLQCIRSLFAGFESSRSPVISSNCSRTWLPALEDRYAASISLRRYGRRQAYIRLPDWWPEPIPEGHVFLLLKSMYGTKQAARRWHLLISAWMEKNGYPAMNSEKTIFMKCDGDEFIIHGLFVDDMMHVPTCDKLKP